MAADTILGGLAQKVGTTEPALRLLISILLGKMWILFSFSFYSLFNKWIAPNPTELFQFLKFYIEKFVSNGRKTM